VDVSMSEGIATLGINYDLAVCGLLYVMGKHVCRSNNQFQTNSHPHGLSNPGYRLEKANVAKLIVTHPGPCSRALPTATLMAG